MPFTTAQSTQIRKWLGFPQLNRFRDPRLESALEVIGADVDASAEVVTLLASLAAIDTALSAALSDAGIKRVDEIEFFPGKNMNGTASLDATKAEGRRYCSRLSQLFGVPLVGDAFGTRGYEGDGFMGPSFQGMGGMTPLG